MVSLVRAIQSFQSGALSKEELFADVDQMLEWESADEGYLLKILEEENTKAPLPEDVHRRVQAKIENAAEIWNKRNREAASSEGEVDPDQSRTRLQNSLLFNGGSDSGTNTGEVNEWSPEVTSRIANDQAQEKMKDVGDILNDRFVLEECIGTGGMSKVYKALDRRKLEADDRFPYVAVKVLNVEFREHPDSLIALQREAKKSQSLAHPNIVRVYDFDRDGSTVYMTMEYLSGRSLATIIRAPGFKGLPEKQAMEILEEICGALEFAHENAIIHADLKPANIILTDDGKVKVIDFGIARAFLRPGPDDTTFDMDATRFNPVSLGALTPAYASPEMLEDMSPDPRDDIYALACITYEMLTGRHPFGRMQATDARDGDLQPKRSKHLTRRQWHALTSALEFERKKRTSNIDEFLSYMRPKNTISLPVPFNTLGKVAVIASLSLFVYLFFIAGFMKEQEADPSLVAAPVESSASQSGTDINSLQVTGIDSDTGSVDVAGPDQEGSVPLLSKQELSKADRLEAPSLVKEDLLSPVLAPAPELSKAAVASVLNEVTCAAFSTSVNEGSVYLRGYVSQQLDINQLKKDLLALPGAKEVSSDLTRFDASKCAIVDLFAPYWAIGRGTDQGVSIKTRQVNNEFVEGDPLIVEISTPSYETYVNIDYFSLDGGVVHMVPGPRAIGNQAPANYQATIGDLGEWPIAAPFGSEMVTILLTPEPLFDSMRNEYESTGDYLAAVEAQLKSMSNAPEHDKIVVDFIMLDTKPKSMLQNIRDSIAGQ